MKRAKPYNIKHSAIALMAGIAALTSSCKHRELDYPENKHAYFYDCIGYCLPILEEIPHTEHPHYDYSELDFKNLTNIANHPTTDTLYMTMLDKSDYSQCPGRSHIVILRSQLQERCDISPRIRGRGNFNFPSGMVTPDDSLAFVQMGFTVNQPSKQR